MASAPPLSLPYWRSKSEHRGGRCFYCCCFRIRSYVTYFYLFLNFGCVNFSGCVRVVRLPRCTPLLRLLFVCERFAVPFHCFFSSLIVVLALFVLFPRRSVCFLQWRCLLTSKKKRKLLLHFSAVCFIVVSWCFRHIVRCHLFFFCCRECSLRSSSCSCSWPCRTAKYRPLDARSKYSIVAVTVWRKSWREMNGLQKKHVMTPKFD